MRLTTLMYIEKDDSYLMIHRVKKENDMSHDKWLGVGGKFEADETPDECVLRETFEETGLTITDYKFRGIVTFLSDTWETEYMHLFTATGYEGEIGECDEGELVWVKKSEVCNLNIWEGDKLFFDRLNKSDDFFSLKVRYEGYDLVEWEFFGEDKKYNKPEK